MLDNKYIWSKIQWAVIIFCWTIGPLGLVNTRVMNDVVVVGLVEFGVVCWCVDIYWSWKNGKIKFQ